MTCFAPLLFVFLPQFFLQLQQAAVSLGDEAFLGDLGVMEVGRLASLEGSLFEGLLALLDRLKGDMMGRMLEWTMREITEKAKPYCQDRYDLTSECLIKGIYSGTY